MSEWREVALGEVLTLQRGFDITKKMQRPGSVPVVSSSGIGSFHDEPRVEGPGVVVGRKGSLGTTFFLETPFWPHDTTLWVKDFKGNDPYFCYLALKTLHLADFGRGIIEPDAQQEPRAPALNCRSAVWDSASHRRRSLLLPPAHRDQQAADRAAGGSRSLALPRVVRAPSLPWS